MPEIGVVDFYRELLVMVQEHGCHATIEQTYPTESVKITDETGITITIFRMFFDKESKINAIIAESEKKRIRILLEEHRSRFKK